MYENSEINLDFKLHKKQLEVFNSKARFKIIQAGRRSGKSYVISVVCLKEMLSGNHCSYISPTHDLNKKFFGDTLKLIPPQLIAKENKSELYIELLTGGFLKFFSSEALGQFRGRNFDLICLDESAHYPIDLEEAWNEQIRATLMDRQGRAIFCSTPLGNGYFNTLYQNAKNGAENWHSFYFTAYDNPHISNEELDSIKSSVPSAVWLQEYLALTGQQKSNAFGGIDVIQKNVRPYLSTLPSIVFGIDIGAMIDYTCITGLDINGNLSYYRRFKGPYELIHQRLKELPENTLKIMDSTGVGQVVYQRLINEGVRNLEGFTFTNESKTRIVYKLIKDVEQSNITYNQEIADEMTNFEFNYTSTGKVQFGASSGSHDDTICSLALSNYHLDQRKAYTNWKLYIL